MTITSERTATYRQLFAIREFRAVFASGALSATGDMLAKVAIAILVFNRTDSALLSAASFAISYLPSIVGGPFLATLADHLPWRQTLVGSDLLRAGLVALLALPGTPLWIILTVLFVVALLTSPFDAARIAMVPSMLPGDIYVLGVSVLNVSYQVSQIVGFAIGGLIVAAISPQGALAVDAVTYAASALLLLSNVRARPAPSAPEQRSTLRRDTVAGLRVIMHNHTPRMLVLLTWIAAAFGFTQEGLAAPVAQELHGGAVAAGLLLAANPTGVVAGGLIITRLMGSERRLLLLRPLALFGCVALIPVALPLPLPAILLLYFISGLGMSFSLPLNAVFNRIMPAHMRGRAAGVVIAGLMAAQGGAILIAGWLADYIPARVVVTIAGLLGALCVLGLAGQWPQLRDLHRPITDFDASPENARREEHEHDPA